MKKLKKNSLFFKILLVVVSGIISVSLSITYIIINISKTIFIDTYGDSQKKYLNK